MPELSLGRLPHDLPEIRVTLDPRGMREQVPHRDLAPMRVVPGQVRGDRFVKADLPLLNQPHDGRGRELLRDRARAEHRLRIRRDLVLNLRQAVALAEDHLPSARNRNRKARGARARHGLARQPVRRRSNRRIRRGLGAGNAGGQDHGGNRQHAVLLGQLLGTRQTRLSMSRIEGGP